LEGARRHAADISNFTFPGERGSRELTDYEKLEIIKELLKIPNEKVIIEVRHSDLNEAKALRMRAGGSERIGIRPTCRICIFSR
jgi:hypothetical protein